MSEQSEIIQNNALPGSISGGVKTGGTKTARARVLPVLLPLRILGSLTFGIILMSVLIVVLAWGTFVESDYGRDVARFVLYGSSWFALLIALLALNIGCSVLLRIPLKRNHLPFVTAHCGILMLLLGSYLTWQSGQEAMLILPEGTVGSEAAVPGKHHFELQNTVCGGTLGKLTEIPFEPGPFNWEDYNRETFRSSNHSFRETLHLAMQWGRRDKGELPLPSNTSGNLQNVKIEVLDYLAGSALQPCPPLDLNILWKKPLRTETDLGEVKEIPRKWERVKLKIPPQERAGSIEVRGTRNETAGGEQICFSLASSPLETAGFLKSASSAALPSSNASWGAVVLFYNNKNYVIPVDDLIAAASVQNGKDGNEKQYYQLQGTGLKIGDVSFRPRGLLLRFALFSAESKTEDRKEYMTLAPDAGEVNVQAAVFGVFGTYIADTEKLALHKDEIQPAVLQRLSKPRLEIMQGTDKRLNYRYWNGKKYAAAGQFSASGGFGSDEGTDGIKTGGKQSIVLETGTPDEVQVITEQFVPQDYPGLRIVPKPVGRTAGTEHRVKLRVTVDGSEDIFYLRPSQVPPERDQVRYVQGNGRAVRIAWECDKVNLGFGVFLKKFEKRTEPGTRTASHYSSLTDLVEVPKNGLSPENRKEPENLPVLQKDVIIKMNQPALFKGNGGRKYSIYQSAFDGPFHPGDYYFHNLYDGKILPWEERPRESLYISKLSVNYDPGRGLKYLGSFLLIFGTVWLFARKEK